MITLWNEILPENYLSPGTLVVPSPQTPCNPTYNTCLPEVWRIPLGICQLNIAFTFELLAMFTP